MAEVDWIKVEGSVTIQDAINTLVGGGTGGVVYIPPGEHLISSTIDVPYAALNPLYNPNRPVTLLGDGAGATVIKSTGGLTASLLHAKRPYTNIEGIMFDGTGLAGAVVTSGGASGDTRHINFRDCVIRGGGAQSLKVPGGATINIQCSYERCVFADNGATAAVEIEERNTTHRFRNCQFTNFRGNAVRLTRCEGISFHDCVFDTNLAPQTGPYVLSDGAQACRVVNCVFDEGAVNPTARYYFLDLRNGSNGWTVLNPVFVRRSLAVPDPSLAQAGRIGLAGACYGVVIIDPVIRMPVGVAVPNLHFDIQQSESECVIVGGFAEVGEPPATTKFPIELTDASRRTAWISHRRWRIPRLTLAETAGVTPREGDLIVRDGWSPMTWSTQSPAASWIPLTVNRYANQAALQAIDAADVNEGMLVWVDDDGQGAGALRVCVSLAPRTFSKVTLV
jgi:hypothetical protein